MSTQVCNFKKIKIHRGKIYCSQSKRNEKMFTLLEIQGYDLVVVEARSPQPCRFAILTECKIMQKENKVHEMFEIRSISRENIIKQAGFFEQKKLFFFYPIRDSKRLFFIFSYFRDLFFHSDSYKFEELSFVHNLVEKRKKTSKGEGMHFLKKKMIFQFFFTQFET